MEEDKRFSNVISQVFLTLATFGIGVLLATFYYGNLDFNSWDINTKSTIIIVTVLVALFS
jgi:hypothetical protein